MPLSSLSPGATLMVTLNAYLHHLAAHEQRKPLGDRQAIPTLDELARLIGIHPVTLSNIANSKIKQLNLTVGGRILAALHHLGFMTTLSDILTYIPPADSSQTS